ncbi:MAG: LuxR family transcriptional regulator, partial [Actinomycetota bacterium]|nr:LuxR family transcriptional regulator [Actinomycetota bacterium]
MSPERAIEYALAMEEPAPPTASGPRRTHTDELINVLTRREQEIAVRVTRRLTNSQIADALAISK